MVTTFLASVLRRPVGPHSPPGCMRVIGQSDLEPLAHRAIPSLGRRWSVYSVPVACSA